MKKTIVTFSLILLLALENSAQTTVLYHFLPTMSQEQAESYRGYDYIVIDPEVPFTSRSAVDALRTQDPNVKVLCYINPSEWFWHMFADKPWSANVVEYLKKIPQWWLKGTDGKYVGVWPDMKTMDCAIDCPRINFDGGKANYIEFITKIYIANILGGYDFDGTYGDNIWERAAWVGHYGENKTGIDRNGDGREDAPGPFDAAWKAGMEFFLSAVRKSAGPDHSIITNPATLGFQGLINGANFEDFPNPHVKDWSSIDRAWYDNLEMAASLPIAIFNSRADNPANLWFTLCSTTLLDNVWFANAQNTAYHRKFELDLGDALGKFRIIEGEYIREFEHGVVYVNPVQQSARIEYEDGWIKKDLEDSFWGKE